MEGEGDEPTPQPTPAQMSEMWRERYGEMVPEKILDTKIGPDGRRYYKVQWAATTMERGNNFLEAELLIKKYWDPVQKKLVLPSMRTNENDSTDGASSSTQCNESDNNDEAETIEPQSSKEKETHENIPKEVADDETSDINNESVSNDNTDSVTTKNVEEGVQMNEEEGEHSVKRKRSDVNEIGSEECSEESEIATKRTKDDLVEGS